MKRLRGDWQLCAECSWNLTSCLVGPAGSVDIMKPAERESRASSVLSGFWDGTQSINQYQMKHLNLKHLTTSSADFWRITPNLVPEKTHDPPLGGMSNQAEDKQKGRMRRTRLHAPTVEGKLRHTLHNPWRKLKVPLFKDEFKEVKVL